jgi:hypothetical protein
MFGLVRKLLGRDRRSRANGGSRPDFFSGRELEAADLQSEQDYRQPVRHLRHRIALFVAVAAIGVVVAWGVRGRSRRCANGEA